MASESPIPARGARHAILHTRWSMLRHSGEPTVRAEFSKSDQIEAMLWGDVRRLVEPLQGGVQGDVRPLLTVTRADFLNYLSAHPTVAHRYFEARSQAASTHDVIRVTRDGMTYRVVALDHGRVYYERGFQILAEAVAEHVLLRHGMY